MHQNNLTRTFNTQTTRFLDNMLYPCVFSNRPKWTIRYIDWIPNKLELTVKNNNNNIMFMFSFVIFPV